MENFRRQLVLIRPQTLFMNLNRFFIGIYLSNQCLHLSSLQTKHYQSYNTEAFHARQHV